MFDPDKYKKIVEDCFGPIDQTDPTPPQTRQTPIDTTDLIKEAERMIK